MYGGPPLDAALAFGRAFCSDDTEHTQMVGRAIALSACDPDRFERELARQFKSWLITMPAGIGFATLRACCKLLLGLGPARSGVASAGNGPAMRAALVGLCGESDAQLEMLIRVSTRLTHTDPRAEEGALVVARAARLALRETVVSPERFLVEVASSCHGTELRECLQAAATALSENKSCLEFAESRGWANGVSGYVNQTVPAALYCWAKSPGDFRQCVEDAVLLGGDTDSVAAITGAICGANLGADAIPAQWINQLADWPRSVDWLTELSKALSVTTMERIATRPPDMRWAASVPRNVLFAAIVVALGLRRLLPPY
jgi:ADP-ribosylglycohydrolase